ncbi:hypothetical protein EJB05_38967, partial [Eragrostis curvula]
MGNAASSSPLPRADPASASSLSPPAEAATASASASTHPREATTPTTTVAANHPAKEDAPADARADGAAETVVVNNATASEEKEDCGFCLFMKGGGCKEYFISWEICVEDAEAAGEDDVERCHHITTTLWKCMKAHRDYYEPVFCIERDIAEDMEAAQTKKGGCGKEGRDDFYNLVEYQSPMRRFGIIKTEFVARSEQ